MSRRRARGSRPLDGSSMTRMLGSMASTRGDGDRALLAAREPVRRALLEVGRADARQRLVDTRSRRLSGADPRFMRPEADVLGHSRHEELVVGVLEDHADRAADVGERALGDRHAADVHRALRRATAGR